MLADLKYGWARERMQLQPTKRLLTFTLQKWKLTFLPRHALIDYFHEINLPHTRSLALSRYIDACWLDVRDLCVPDFIAALDVPLLIIADCRPKSAVFTALIRMIINF
jgi:hypothetical protein